MITDLLDVSRLDQGRALLSPELLNLGQVVAENLALLRPQIDERRLAVTVQFEDHLPPLWLDRRHAERIVQSLLGNAVKYSHPAGQVTIKLDRRDSAVVLEVADTGVGIPLAAQPNLFKRIPRADNALALEVSGTGLGLSLTKRLVELNGGRIYFRSEENRGSIFYVAFPIPIMRAEPVRAGERAPAA